MNSSSPSDYKSSKMYVRLIPPSNAKVQLGGKNSFQQLMPSSRIEWTLRHRIGYYTFTAVSGVEVSESSPTDLRIFTDGSEHTCSITAVECEKRYDRNKYERE